MADAATIQPVGDVAGAQLLDIADRAIIDGLDDRLPELPMSADLHADLHQRLGAFVTLSVSGALNGCIGSIDGAEPLCESVARHAWSAAFADPRLPPLRRADYPHLSIDVSVLSPLLDIASGSRDELLGALRPGVDGLLISSGARRAVFLPSVWERMHSPDEFIDQLLRKAGLDTAGWSQDLRGYRFTAQKIGRSAR